MPLPHLNFNPIFIGRLRVALNLARNHRQLQEVWCLMHFDEDIRSLETFHSHGTTGAIYYRNALQDLNAGIQRITGNAPTAAERQTNGALARMIADVHVAQAGALGANYVAMHAEEELILAFPRIIGDWIGAGNAHPQRACLYLNFSPCARSPAKIINGVQYPLGCMQKLPTLANLQLAQQIDFTVYYDALFENAQPYQALLTAAATNTVTFAPMPHVLM